MANLIINGTTYSGTPTAQTNPYKPNSLKRKRVKVGTLHVAANGTSTWIHRGVKLVFTIEWEKASLTTQAAVRALRDLTTTFSFTNFDSVAYTVLTVGDDDYEETITTDAANTYLVDMTLVLREA
jgi:hypothetical protein